MEVLQSFIGKMGIPALVIIGIMSLAGLYSGRSMRYIRLPSIIGFMLAGALLGPSLLGLLNDPVQERFGFITEIALGFVSLSIGLELSFASLREQGRGILLIILSESFLAFGVVTGALYLLTHDIALSLIFGAIAPASAPAGTVAVIQEYKARGKLTRALYAVVGFDDGLGIVIFGFVSAFVRRMVSGETAGGFSLFLLPLREIGLSVAVGGLMGLLYILLSSKTSGSRDLFVLVFGSVLISTGLCTRLHLSVILTNMVIGMVMVNSQPRSLVQKTKDRLSEVMPLLFILFFVLAGANLRVRVLPALGLIGLFYLLSRTAGLMGGAWLGALVGKASREIRKYLGMGILSQAGVAIGLSIIVKHEFSPLSPAGARIGSMVINTITATCIIFEIIGPLLTKLALKKAGEIGGEFREAAKVS